MVGKREVMQWTIAARKKQAKGGAIKHTEFTRLTHIYGLRHPFFLITTVHCIHLDEFNTLIGISMINGSIRNVFKNTKKYVILVSL
jgi:hypothetical protein